MWSTLLDFWAAMCERDCFSLLVPSPQPQVTSWLKLPPVSSYKCPVPLWKSAPAGTLDSPQSLPLHKNLQLHLRFQQGNRSHHKGRTVSFPTLSIASENGLRVRSTVFGLESIRLRALGYILRFSGGMAGEQLRVIKRAARPDEQWCTEAPATTLQTNSPSLKRGGDPAPMFVFL